MSVGLALSQFILAGQSFAASQSASPLCQTQTATSVVLSPGETLTLTVSPPSVCNVLTVAVGLGNGTLIYGPPGSEVPYTTGPPVTINPGDRIIFTMGTSGTPRINLWSGFSGNFGSNSAFLVASEGGGSDGGSSSSPSASSLPTPVIQQFVKPGTGPCADAAPTSLNWSSVSSGGWGESWAQWPNGGKGGAVCTRTLVYSTSQSAWTVEGR